MPTPSVGAEPSDEKEEESSSEPIASKASLLLDQIEDGQQAEVGNKNVKQEDVKQGWFPIQPSDTIKTAVRQHLCLGEKTFMFLDEKTFMELAFRGVRKSVPFVHCG